MNFLHETTKAVQDSGHSTDNVMFVGSFDGEYRLTWTEFVAVADFEYSDDFGAAEVATDLIVYFRDQTYMTRGEYDGSEWWEYVKKLDYKETDPHKKFKEIASGRMWSSVEKHNEKTEVDGS